MGSSSIKTFDPAHAGGRGDVLLVLDVLFSTTHVPIHSVELIGHGLVCSILIRAIHKAVAGDGSLVLFPNQCREEESQRDLPVLLTSG